MKPQRLVIYVAQDGRLTRDGLLLLQGQADAIAALQAKLAAIAAVVAPTGGATIDTQARTAISAIITGAA